MITYPSDYNWEIKISALIIVTLRVSQESLVGDENIVLVIIVTISTNKWETKL